MVKRVKIFVFGTSSAGKTSVTNLLTGTKREVGKDAKGCTLETEACSTNYKDIEYIFYDTAGLNEGAGDPRVSSKEAIKNLVNLLKEFEDGFNLVMYVRKISAIGTLDDRNIKALVEDKLPLIIVNTGAENTHPVNQWWEDNRDQFLKAKYTFADGVSVCTIVLTTETDIKKDLEKIYAVQRKESKEILWSCIEKNRLADGRPVILSNSVFWETFLNVIDYVSKKTGLRSLIGHGKEKANLINVFTELDFKEDEAEQLINTFNIVAP